MNPTQSLFETPTILLVPSAAAGVELPRRLASTGRALFGLRAFQLLDLARLIAEPDLLGRGLAAWDSGHATLLAARLLDDEPEFLPADAPRAPVAAVLARTLTELRLARVAPEALAGLAFRAGLPEDRRRLSTLTSAYRRFCAAIEGRFADSASLLVTATERVGQTDWLNRVELLVVDELELTPAEQVFLSVLAKKRPVHRLEGGLPPSLWPTSFEAWAEDHGIPSITWASSVLHPIAPQPSPEGISRLRQRLFEPPLGTSVADESVVLLTAPGESAEVESVVRLFLREATRGVRFEEMGVALAQPAVYASLFTDLLARLGIPHRLHPSLPLRYGRAARSLLLLFRCRDLTRTAVMEFLTYAPVPFEALLGEERVARPAIWDVLTREAKIVSGYERWMVGLRALAEAEREAAAAEDDADRRARRLRRADDAETILRVVEVLSATLDSLGGEAAWPEWSARLLEVFDQWIGPDRDRHAVAEVLHDLAGLGSLASHARWADVEDVLEARFDWTRQPVDPITSGAVHVGALDAIAGLPFRVLAIPGLVEGGFPGIVPPDPFLLDAEREAISLSSKPRPQGQLRLFEDTPEETTVLSVSHDRLQAQRRSFHRAIRQATERLILSYPRADPRTGRERMPSLFFATAASVLAGRPVGMAELAALTREDDPAGLDIKEALDASQRDRIRMRADRATAELAIAAGSPFFQNSRLATQARWSNRLTRYDGQLTDLPTEVAQRLDPTVSAAPVSASRLATFSQCGFEYFLHYVLGLDPVLEPEERKRLDPIERGSVFHEVAERFLRDRRDHGRLPVRDTAEEQDQLDRLVDERMEALVAGSPLRYTTLWDREHRRLKQMLRAWLEREAAVGERAIPAHFEVSFGLSNPGHSGEPHRSQPLTVDLGDGRSLRVSGKIDRIDRRRDGGLILRDYKTGRAPRDDGAVFRGGRQLQIPFYILASRELFPSERIEEAFLDYVDGGRRISVDPDVVSSESFRSLLRDLANAIGEGIFVQEPSACERCDFTAVCGPSGLIEVRRRYKIGDRRLQRYLRLRDVV